MTGNLRHWQRFADIDPQFTKPISGKDYKGTSPNPQYVIQCLTEMFGPVGEGFGWRVLEDGFEALGDTHLHWCRIEFWHTDRANTFEAYGQTKAAYPTSKGFHRVDEDAPKKSLTDAITKAAAQIGVAANIFLGRWDDSRYVAAVNDEYREAEKPRFDSKAFAERMSREMAMAGSLPDLRDKFTEVWLHKDHLPEIILTALTATKDQRRKELESRDPAMQAPPDSDHVAGGFDA
jgi:hypothetical protein